MIQVKDMGGYLNIWSDANKQICENNEMYWNATEESPIAVDKGRFANGDYVESETDIEDEILENIENLVDNNE